MNCWDLDADGVADLEEDLDGDGAVDVADCQGAPFGISCSIDQIMIWDVDAWVCAPAPFASSPREAVFFDDFFGAVDTRIWSVGSSGGNISFGTNYLGIVYIESTTSEASLTLRNSIPSGANLFGVGGRPSLVYEVQFTSLGANHRAELGFTNADTLVGGVRWTGSAWEAVCRQWGDAAGPEHSVPIASTSFKSLRLELDGANSAIDVYFDGVEVATLAECESQFISNGSGVTLQSVADGYGIIALDYVAWRMPR